MKTYTADRELAALIKESTETGEPLRVRADNTDYELDVKSPAPKDLWEDYDPEAAKEAWGKAFGTWKDVDVEAVIKRIRSWRDQDTPGRPADIL